MLSNAYFLAKFRFDTAENEPAKNLQNFANFPNLECQTKGGGRCSSARARTSWRLFTRVLRRPAPRRKRELQRASRSTEAATLPSRTRTSLLLRWHQPLLDNRE